MLKNDDVAQIDTLEIGLSNKLKYLLVFITRPDTMADYERQLLALDNRIKARVVEKKGTCNPMGQFVATVPMPPSSSTHGSLTPRDLSAT